MYIYVHTCVCVGKTRKQIEREGGIKGEVENKRKWETGNEEEQDTNWGGERTNSAWGWNVRGRGRATEGVCVKLSW